MKKVFIVLAVALLFSFPVTANILQDSDLSVGLGVGESVYATGRLDLDRTMAVVLNLGFGYGTSAKGLMLRPQLQYSVSELEFDIGAQRMYPYFGAALPVGLTGGYDMSVNAVVGISYYMDDMPLEFFIEALPGLRLFRGGEFKLGFDFGGSLGARWILGR